MLAALARRVGFADWKSRPTAPPAADTTRATNTSRKPTKFAAAQVQVAARTDSRLFIIAVFSRIIEESLAWLRRPIPSTRDETTEMRTLSHEFSCCRLHYVSFFCRMRCAVNSSSRAISRSPLSRRRLPRL